MIRLALKKHGTTWRRYRSQCLLVLLYIIGSIQNDKTWIICKKIRSPARPSWFGFWSLWYIENMGERHYISNLQIELMHYALKPAITEPWNPWKIQTCLENLELNQHRHYSHVWVCGWPGSVSALSPISNNYIPWKHND